MTAPGPIRDLLCTLAVTVGTALLPCWAAETTEPSEIRLGLDPATISDYALKDHEKHQRRTKRQLRANADKQAGDALDKQSKPDYSEHGRDAARGRSYSFKNGYIKNSSSDEGTKDDDAKRKAQRDRDAKVHGYVGREAHQSHRTYRSPGSLYGSGRDKNRFGKPPKQQR